MVRGILSGIIWGVVVVGGVLSVASLLAPLPATVSPQTEAAAGTEGDTDAVAEGTPLQNEADAQVEARDSDDVVTSTEEAAPVLSDTSSAPKPDAVTEEANIIAPKAPEGTGAVTGTSDSPVVATAPSAPEGGAAVTEELSISTSPPQPPTPSATTGGVFGTDDGEDSAGLSVSEPAPTPTPEDISPEAEVPEEAGETTDNSLLKPAGSLLDGDNKGKSERLPSVGAGAETAEVEVAKPFVANAQPFENVDGKPIMSIVLIDEGAGVNLDALAGFPYPLSVAVSTLDPDVKSKAAQYRAQGMEVLAMVDMPAAAGASDVEVAMQAHLSVSDDFVAIMEGLGDGLQGAKVVSDQVADVALNEGYGLVLFGQGLNTAQKLAAKDGVPSASVFRDFDGKGQSAVVIRRFLDQAAFKAPQENGVVMVGRLRDETISALVLWGLQDRAGTVALAPVSAALNTIN
ncbi:polysaccharide deacetylase 2 family uncharacterized protein YibQ [Shimia isoporae]|uniref:Polysaccharide deacetylase 2 family uncharacterized protein YibQ n=1 Tax=Shimia isoporae TaxID=647720 RepID=A0A4R1NP83_9RHOB|nr:divergent polysaccharide deacetylase family protein [Shimia isoporae]TCL09651.1 polysaccharide deacetylase 2 family uncharacterized protein YibQ [Shimia isoporae]